jgi:hypothetical protein
MFIPASAKCSYTSHFWDRLCKSCQTSLLVFNRIRVKENIKLIPFEDLYEMYIDIYSGQP